MFVQGVPCIREHGLWYKWVIYFNPHSNYLTGIIIFDFPGRSQGFGMFRNNNSAQGYIAQNDKARLARIGSQVCKKFIISAKHSKEKFIHIHACKYNAFQCSRMRGNYPANLFTRVNTVTGKCASPHVRELYTSFMIRKQRQEFRDVRVRKGKLKKKKKERN